MKFIDETIIRVEAGKGGDGCLSFRREKYVPRGGPDGGDGGAGGSVVLVADDALNTLVDFRYRPLYRATPGARGGGNQRSGEGGADLRVAVPMGTVVIDEDTHQVLGDLGSRGAELVVAQGGRGGVGNARFKSSRNRAPRRTIPGGEGGTGRIRLQLRVIADVGLVGVPNAGKSSLIRAVSAAQPKVADYPFTTLVPNLGVVRADVNRSFVIADIPGLIAGAAQGAGLGVRFLKHLSRTRLLLHVVDIAPVEGELSAREAVAAVEAELAAYSEALAELPRWLVLNKTDLVPQKEVTRLCKRIQKAVGWSGPIFAVSAVSKAGTEALVYAVADELERQRELDHAQMARQLNMDVLARTWGTGPGAEQGPAPAREGDDESDEPDFAYRR